jgi:hypothetical protein
MENINTWIKLGLMCICLLGITTCTSDEFQKEDQPVTEDPFKEGSVPIKVPLTKSVNDADPENRVVSVRLIIIRQNVVTNNKVISNIASTVTDVQLTDVVPAGYVDLFVIVNELPSWGLGSIQINDVLSSQVLKQKVLNFSAYPVVSSSQTIPMFKMYEHLRITINGETLLDGAPVSLSAVERLYAKVSLNLKCTFAELANGGDPIEIKQVSVKNMPKESYLAPMLYTKNGAADLFNGNMLALKLDSNYIWTADSLKSNFVCYIPEYLVSDTGRYTYVSAVVNLKDDANSEREYKIVIGDGIESGNAYMLGNTKLYSDIRVSRNTHYQFTGIIKSFDIRAEEDIEIRPKILVWETVGLDSTLIDDYNFTVSQHEFQRATGTAFNGVIEVTTDHPNGWSAVVAPTGARPTSLTGGPYTNKPSGKLTFTYSGATIASPAADTIKVTVGKLTKKFIIKN